MKIEYRNVVLRDKNNKELHGQLEEDIVTDSGKFTIDSKNLGAHKIGLNNYTFSKPPEKSEWLCYLFGNRPGGNGMAYRPNKGQEPNWLARWFMRVCFDCLWVKDKPKPEEQIKNYE